MNLKNRKSQQKIRGAAKVALLLFFKINLEIIFVDFLDIFR